MLTKNRIPHFIQTLDAHWHRRSEFLRKKRNPQLLKHIPEFDQFGIVDASSGRQLPLVINRKLTNLGHTFSISAWIVFQTIDTNLNGLHVTRIVTQLAERDREQEMRWEQVGELSRNVLADFLIALDRIELLLS